MSTSAQLRKIKKPLIEKKRRERMNDCLNQLKALVLEGRNTNSNESRYSKMEKVDILQMTVGYLKDVRRSLLLHQSQTSSPVQSIASKYVKGYSECADEVRNYLRNTKEMSEETKKRLFQHLSNALKNCSFSASYSASSSPSSLCSSSAESSQVADSQRTGAYLVPDIPFPSSPEQGSPLPASKNTCTYALPTMFAIFPATTSTQGNAFLATPSNPSPAIIPLYVSSLSPENHLHSSLVSSPSSSPAGFHPTQPAVVLPSAVEMPLQSSNHDQPSASLFLSQSTTNSVAVPTLMVVTGDMALHPCASPRQGDECPAAAFLAVDSFPTPIRKESPWHTFSSPNQLERPSVNLTNPLSVENNQLRNQAVTSEVWRPWYDQNPEEF